MRASCVCLSRDSSSALDYVVNVDVLLNTFLAAHFYLTTKTTKKGKLVSRMSAGPNTSKLRPSNKPELRETHTLGLAGRSQILLTLNKRHLVSKFNYKDGSSRGNAAQAIGGTRVAPQEKTCNTR